MNRLFFLFQGVRKKVIFAVLALLLVFVLIPQKASAPVGASFPQTKPELNPAVVAVMVPVPERKPALERFSFFKGLSDLWLKDVQKISVSTQAVQEKPVKISGLAREVQVKLKSGDPVEALQFFRNAPARLKLDVAEHDRIQSAIAAGFLYDGKIESAGKLAMQSARRSGPAAPMAGWVAGLSLWQQGKYDLAAVHFEMVSASDEASSWMASAGAFWASRAHERAGNNRAMMIALQRAAQNPRTFYGLMAVQALGQDFDFNWDAPAFNAQRAEILRSAPAGARAIELVAKGSYDAAQSELLSLVSTKDDDMREAVLAFAAHSDLPKVLMRLGNSALRDQGTYLDVALYPVSPWKPKDGFSVDPALVHAVMRQESKFDVSARSQSGAMGLMQILPSTAKYVSRGAAPNLNSPKENLKVGQDYLAYLLRDRNVDGDILKLLVAYNAGPGNLAKWQSQIEATDDPLLFIEMIPVNETREYVEKVMASYWMYSLRDGKDVPSLRAISKGEPARYAQALDEGVYRLAMAR